MNDEQTHLSHPFKPNGLFRPYMQQLDEPKLRVLVLYFFITFIQILIEHSTVSIKINDTNPDQRPPCSVLLDQGLHYLTKIN